MPFILLIKDGKRNHRGTTVDVKADWKKVGTRRMTVKIDQPDVPQVNDYFLRVNYVADVAMAFIGGYLVLDHYYYGDTMDNRFETIQK